MSSQPLITTVIPTYRRPHLPPRAVRSVLRQEYPHFEVSVYDNASGDETPKVVAELSASDPRIKYHCHSRNIGMMENFAFGIAHVATPFFSILSDDDFILPGFYQAASRALEEYPEAAFFTGGLIYAVPDGGIVHSSINKWPSRGLLRQRDLFMSLLPGAWLTWTGTVFRSECVKRAGGLDLKAGDTGDVDLIQRLAAANPGFVDSHPCGVMTLHAQSASTSNGPAELERHLSLRSYTNLRQVIRTALRDGSLTELEAKEMSLKLTRETTWGLFRRAIIFGSAGQTALAHKTGEVLLAEFGRRDLAVMLRLFASDGISGRAARSWIRYLRTIRQKRRRPGSRSKIDPSSGIVLDTIRALASGMP